MKKIAIILFGVAFYQCNIKEKKVKNDLVRFVNNSSTMENTISLSTECFFKKQKTYYPLDVVLVELKDNLQDIQYRYISRIVGIPGDTVYIKGGEVYVNTLKVAHSSNAKFNFRILVKKATEPMIAKYNLQKALSGKEYNYEVTMTLLDSSLFKKEYGAEIISMKRGFNERFNQTVLLNGKNNRGWDLDNFGPIIIPRKGAIIGNESVFFFNNLSENSMTDGSIIINKAYYFIVCDNFHDGNDSRDYGLISEEQIIGVRVL